MKTNYKWFVVAMLWFVCFFNYADRQAIFSVFEPIKGEMRLSDAQLGVIGASFMWVYAAAAPLAGLVGDRFRRKTLILGGLIFWSLITVATAFSKNYTQLVICRALEGFGEAFYFPASMSLVSDYHGRNTRSRAMAIHQSSVYAGTIAGGSVAGVMADHYGWRSSFYLFGWFGVALGLVLLFFLKEARRGQAEEGETEIQRDREREEAPRNPLKMAATSNPANLLAPIGEILRTPMARVLILVFVGANFVAMIFLTWMPTYLKRHFGMSLSMAGVSATAYLQIASVLGVITGGVLADQLAKKHRGGRMMAQSLGLLAGVPFIFLTGWTLSIPVLVLALIGFGYFKGIYDANIWASLHDVVKPERRATAVGVMNAIGWLGGGMGTYAIGVAAPIYGMSGCLSANSLVYLLVGLLMIFGVRAYFSGKPMAARITDLVKNI
ncbi:MAG TPA: MFS transporter [Blastocatellia bacterium]|jgi:MFS family permease|nr:MFS transporter [Blastocatellia bacterium]